MSERQRAYKTRVTERDWERQVAELCTLFGVRYRFHPWNSIHSASGWPDLAIVTRDNRFIVVELKSATGRLTEAQRNVLDILTDAGVAAFLWRPDDFEEAVAILRGAPPEPESGWRSAWATRREETDA